MFKCNTLSVKKIVSFAGGSKWGEFVGQNKMSVHGCGYKAKGSYLVWK
jgi:hypothetical protein